MIIEQSEQRVIYYFRRNYKNTKSKSGSTAFCLQKMIGTNLAYKALVVAKNGILLLC